MNILFINDYLKKGGGEISSYWQEKKLGKKGIRVINYALAKKNQAPLSYFLNPILILINIINIKKIVDKNKIKLIHCQGKYSVPTAVIAKSLLSLPLIITLRDYKGICNHNFCLYDRKKGCNLLSFFKKDFLYYQRNYLKDQSFFSFLKQLFFSYGARIYTLLLKYFLKKADKFVCVSNYIRDIYSLNGYDKKKMIVVYNQPPDLNLSRVKISNKIKKKIEKYNTVILYAGKLSLGKGADLLISSAEKIIKKNKNILFIFCGNVYYPVKKVASNQILFFNKIEHSMLLKIMKMVDIVCIPSIWPEPLSRVTIEAFYMGKPVLSSNAGGQTEFVSEKNGWLFEPSLTGLEKILLKAIKQRQCWQGKGEQGKKLILKLEKENIKKLIGLYKSLI